MSGIAKKYRVGELRPSQVLFSYGVGSIIDLPHISTLVMGLDDWVNLRPFQIGEERLLAAVRSALGPQVTRLLAPPGTQEQPDLNLNAFDESALVGVPVAAFPRWMLCPRCRRLAQLDSGLFELKANPYRPDLTRYVHTNCSTPGSPPAVVPARFMTACTYGHLDDFPWLLFVHGEKHCPSARLKLIELGVSGEAADIQVMCEVCKEPRRMSDAFGTEGKKYLPMCKGRRPHLRDYAPDGCEEQLRTIILGASNSWFPIVLSTFSIPEAVDKLAQLVNDHWSFLQKTVNVQNIELLREIGRLESFSSYTDGDIWQKIEEKRNATQGEEEVLPASLRVPEWQVLSNPSSAPQAQDFKVTPVNVPSGYEHLIKQVVLVERLREVRALIGFTRIESPGDFMDIEEFPEERRAPLSRKSPRWVPASDVRGEGIFLQFDELAIRKWAQDVQRHQLDRTFREAHTKWRAARRVADPASGYPGLRYVLLHSFSHALMRQLTLECGYTSASIRERIYSLSPEHDHGPMAGILLYTAAPDSEGTLGGLVSLGNPDQLVRHINGALEQMHYCTSDPLCAEHSSINEQTLHEAACHACMFVPETSCERGNKYLDRSVLLGTVDKEHLAFFV